MAGNADSSPRVLRRVERPGIEYCKNNENYLSGEKKKMLNLALIKTSFCSTILKRDNIEDFLRMDLVRATICHGLNPMAVLTVERRARGRILPLSGR